jgi:hypothetical protein
VHRDSPPDGQALHQGADAGHHGLLKHGASAPQVREAAQRRVAEQQAREVARRMDVDPDQFDGNPFEALRDLLRRDQAEMERFGRLADRFEDDELTYTTRSGAEQLRAVLDAYRQERDALGRRLDLLLRAGVAERMIQVREAQHKTAQTGVTELFGHCLTLFAGDVSSALCDAGAYEHHDQVMTELKRRVRQRLEHEQTMIVTQIEIMARKDSGPAQQGQWRPA